MTVALKGRGSSRYLGTDLNLISSPTTSGPEGEFFVKLPSVQEFRGKKVDRHGVRKPGSFSDKE
jgi:hypothetical protein